jgi:hypothetical protein
LLSTEVEAVVKGLPEFRASNMAPLDSTVSTEEAAAFLKEMK